jgi:hypothetical protein
LEITEAFFARMAKENFMSVRKIRLESVVQLAILFACLLLFSFIPVSTHAMPTSSEDMAEPEFENSSTCKALINAELNLQTEQDYLLREGTKPEQVDIIGQEIANTEKLINQECER